MGKNRIRDIIKLTPFLLSDGGISPHAKNSWLIYFRNNDTKLIKEFQCQLKTCCGRTGYLQKRKDGSFMVKLTSVELGEELLNLSSTYRTKDCNLYPVCTQKGRLPCKKCTKPKTSAKIPDKIFENTELARYFLQVYFSCDGGVSITATKTKYPFLIRKVFVSVKHRVLAEGLMNLLKKFDFSPRYYGDQIRLTTKTDILNFNSIGFLNGCRVGKDSKRFYGKTKNHMLRVIIKSYNHPKKFIQNSY